MNVLIAPDKFKGSLTALQVCDAIEETFREIYPEYSIAKIPMADGGEGTAEILTAMAGGKTVRTKARDPLFREIESWYGLSPDGITAFIEMSAASGLQLLKEDERNPRFTSSIGTGDLILNAIQNGARKIIVGCGGSATNDAGIGMASALGVQFLNENGIELKPIGENLLKIETIDINGLRKELKNCHLTFIADVVNPLFGKQGAAYIFAPQKGAKPEDIILLDNGLKHFSEVIEEKFSGSTHFSGAGAAGGLPVSAKVFLNADHQRGIDFIMRWSHMEDKIKQSDWVITGEGKFDSQSLNGKVVSGIAQVCKKYQKKLWVICGVCDVRETDWKEMGIQKVIAIASQILGLNESMMKAEELIQNQLKESIK